MFNFSFQQMCNKASKDDTRHTCTKTKYVKPIYS